MLVQTPPKDLKLSDGQENHTGVILVEPPTPSSSRSRSEQTLHNGNDNDHDHADENGKDGKGKQVKEGDYLKSKLWWFGLLLIATGEGGKHHVQISAIYLYKKVR